MGASLVAHMVKNLPAIQGTWVQSLGEEDPLEGRAWQPTPVFLPGKFHGQRSLGGLQSLALQRVGQDLAQDRVYLHVNSLRWQFRALRLLLRMCFSHLVLPAGPEGGRAGSKLPSSLMCRGFKDLLVLSTFFFEINFYWSIVALSCCASFCHTAKRVRYTHTHTHTHTHIPSFFHFFPI